MLSLLRKLQDASFHLPDTENLLNCPFFVLVLLSSRSAKPDTIGAYPDLACMQLFSILGEPLKTWQDGYQFVVFDVSEGDPMCYGRVIMPAIFNCGKGNKGIEI